MAQILISGANGWIGSALGRVLVKRGHSVWGLTRRAGSVPTGVREWIHEAPDFAGLGPQWQAQPCFDIVFHLAARVHAGRDDSATSEDDYHESNTVATVRLAHLARDHGVRRFVFASSAKALGEKDPGRAWCENDDARPLDAYGRSKLAAEVALREIEGIETVIVRPPLVYGPGVRANFARLLHAVRSGWPLPLGCAHAERSLIALDNLTDALIECAMHPEASGHLFHVADRETLSVRELIVHLGSVFDRSPRLVPVPLTWLRGMARVIGREPEVSRLTDPLRLDTQLVQNVLNWRAPISVEEGLERTADWYRNAC